MGAVVGTVGSVVGTVVGASVGCVVGTVVGASVGCIVGTVVGASVGCVVGTVVGVAVGATAGAVVSTGGFVSMDTEVSGGTSAVQAENIKISKNAKKHIRLFFIFHHSVLENVQNLLTRDVEKRN